MPRESSKSGILLPCEWVILASVALTLSLYAFFGISLRYPTAIYLRNIKGTLLGYVMGILLMALITRLVDIRESRRIRAYIPWSHTWSEFNNRYLVSRSIVYDLRVLNALTILFVVFVNLKHLIPFINSSNYDLQIIDFESVVFGHQLLSGRLHELLTVGAAPFLSQTYTVWYGYVSILIYCIVFQRSRLLTEQFAVAFMLMWFLGIIMVYCFPTWGPCFSLRQHFTVLPETAVSRMQADLWKDKLYFDKFPHGSVGLFLISGLPSLHFAATLLGSLYLKRIHPLLSALSWSFAVLTFISTIYFGWHFVIDDLAAIPLVALSIFLAKTVSREDSR